MERVGRSEDFTRVAIARGLESADIRVREVGGWVFGWLVGWAMESAEEQVNVTQTETRKLGRCLEFFMYS